MPSFGPLLSIRIEGNRDAQGRFARSIAAVPRARREELRELGRRVVLALQKEAPVRTGRLRKGITFKTRDSGWESEVRVTSEAPYTVYVIRGRGPVVAKRAKALRFEPGPLGSGFIFRKRVRAAKANPFHRRAFDSLGDETTMAARRVARRVLAAFQAT